MKIFCSILALSINEDNFSRFTACHDKVESTMSTQIIKDEGKVTQRLTVYDVFFGAQDWNGEICFPPYLEVIKEDPDEDEIFVI